MALDRHGVEWIMAGSVAALAWFDGAWPFTPGDLDVVPRGSPENLRRLAGVLEELRARPARLPNWPGNPSAEARAAWRPEPATEVHLDHLFDTSCGRLDVVPWRAGRFEELRPRAHALEAWGMRVWVADPEDLASTLRPTKAKHRERAELMEAIRARRARGGSPCRLTAGGPADRK